MFYPTKNSCRWLSLVLGLAFAIGWAAGQARFAAVCADVRADTVRLHIVAASNTVADQSCKLRVRDAVLQAAESLCAGAATQQQALEKLQAGLPVLEQAARRALTRAGRPMPVKVQLGSETFSTTCYAGGTLPAGQYDSLRLVLGEGAGENWFCCLYPSLCLAAAGSYRQADENAVVSSGGYEIRFALLDWWQSLREA